jgi:hypothetical protein
VIRVSITDGSLSSDCTAIAGLPFSNSIGFNPLRTNNAYDPPLDQHSFDMDDGLKVRASIRNYREQYSGDAVTLDAINSEDTQWTKIESKVRQSRPRVP